MLSEEGIAIFTIHLMNSIDNLLRESVNSVPNLPDEQKIIIHWNALASACALMFVGAAHGNHLDDETVSALIADFTADIIVAVGDNVELKKSVPDP